MPKQTKHWAAVATSLLLCGCYDPTPPPPQTMPQSLLAANAALTGNQPDVALVDADAYLRQYPHGPSAAGAHYLRGQAYYMKIATDRAEQRQMLVQAGTEYREALNELMSGQAPDPSLEADVRSELSNVAFFQDDFPTSIEQAQEAARLTDAPQLKRFMLFRIGTSQQRLGLFDEAKLTFHQIQQRYPGTLEAAAARDQEGQHQFYVQLGTYPTATAAPTVTVDRMKSPGGPMEGVITASRTDAAGHTIVDAGPFANYPAAKAVRDQVIGQFPDAIVKP